MPLVPQNPDYRATVCAIFDRAHFLTDLGIRFADCGPGWCEATLIVEPRHGQQDGYVHAAVQAAMADHTAGAAAGTLVAPQETILSVEYKIQLLRPCRGARLRCRAEVLRPGRRIHAVEAWVWAIQTDPTRAHREVLTSKLTATMTVVPQARGEQEVP